MNTMKQKQAQHTLSARSAQRRTAKRAFVSLAALTLLTLQVACVSNISSQTKESNKDTTGAYDGRWIAQVQRSAGKQIMPNNWYANCDGKAREFNFRVNDGVAELWFDNNLKKTLVSTKGDFRFDIPLAHKAQAAVGSSATIGLTGTSRIFYGNLAKEKGRTTFAYEAFGNNGCTAIVRFVRK